MTHRAAAAAARRWLLALGLAAAGPAAQAITAPLCEREVPVSAQQQDRLLRFGAIVKDLLDASGQRVALVSRSGTNLDRFGVRYSHTGVTLKASGNTPWSVRQLYYACDEQKARLFDQGMSGFVLGANDPELGYVSLVLPPPLHAAALERTALDNRLALQLLGGRYSANAYPFSTRYQNCNQWIAELIATAWGELASTESNDGARGAAQRWLATQGYLPTVFEARDPFTFLATAFVPLLHRDDHPADDLSAWRYQISMPQAIEAFVQRGVPDARRIELCHANGQVVVHEGWTPVATGCVPGPGDRVISLD